MLKLNYSNFSLAQTAVTLDSNRVSLPIDALIAPVIAPRSSTGSSSSGSSNDSNEFTISPLLDNDLITSNNKKSPVANSEQKKQNEFNSNENKEEIIARINLKTGLNISLNEDDSIGSTLKAHLSNGKYAYIRILPAEASAIAQEKIKTNCAETNCTVELKERKINGELKAIYEVKIEKTAKLLGFIKMKEQVRVDIDPETGAVLDVHKPWWVFLAKE